MSVPSTQNPAGLQSKSIDIAAMIAGGLIGLPLIATVLAVICMNLS